MTYIFLFSNSSFIGGAVYQEKTTTSAPELWKNVASSRVTISDPARIRRAFCVINIRLPFNEYVAILLLYQTNPKK